MKSWQEDLLGITAGLCSEHEVFEKIEDAAKSLGFEYCAYGLRVPLPLSNPKTFIISNYPAEWQQRYADADYLTIDPTVLHGRRTQSPLVWSDKVFASAQSLWDEAKAQGLCVGWAQSSLDAFGVGGMLSLSRSNEMLSVAELAEREPEMRWLVNLSHMTLSRFFTEKFRLQSDFLLTYREVEVLKWTADGKTSGEISDILSVSGNTVNFHIKNVICKMQVANKTAAVVRAAMLGLLN
jgi:LuxR family transcriptional regulator